MRKVICLFLLAAFVNNARAQFIKIGPKVGANLQKIESKSFKEGYQLGYYAGIFAELKLGEKWEIQPEVLFNETKFDQSSDFRDIYRNILSVDSASKIKLSQLSIPITLNYKIANVLALQVGPQFSINMDKNKTLLKNAGDAFTAGDFAMVGGVKFMLSKFRITGRYVLGLSNINDIDNKDQWKSQSVQLGVGFVF
ncbi:MAG: porin family protein [Bacteroidota bacterium]